MYIQITWNWVLPASWTTLHRIKCRNCQFNNILCFQIFFFLGVSFIGFVYSTIHTNILLFYLQSWLTVSSRWGPKHTFKISQELLSLKTWQHFQARGTDHCMKWPLLYVLMKFTLTSTPSASISWSCFQLGISGLLWTGNISTLTTYL